MATDAVSTSLDNGGSCLIITGAPAPGKSTVSRLVAERLARSARLNGDFVHELIVSAFVWRLGEPPEEATHQVRLTRKNLCAFGTRWAGGSTPQPLTPDETATQIIANAVTLAGRGILIS